MSGARVREKPPTLRETAERLVKFVRDEEMFNLPSDERWIRDIEHALRVERDRCWTWAIGRVPRSRACNAIRSGEISERPGPEDSNVR